MPFKQKQVHVLLGYALATGAFAMAAATAQAQQVERIIVTGSSISRATTEGALPVTTISREDIERIGVSSAQDLINAIPSNFNSSSTNGGGVVANNVGATGIASTANLRAMGPKYTLVLLNGRRVADFGFGNAVIDLNSIPLAAIERVEVLRDGASAIYGSDAIAGVINFITKKDFVGAEASLSFSHPYRTGGEVTNFSFTAGMGKLAEDKYNFMISAATESDSKVLAKDRDFANTAVRPDLGVNKSSSRNGIPNLNFTDTLGNKYTGVNPLRYNGCNAPDYGLTQIGSPKGCGTDYVKFIDLIPEQTHDSVLARATFQLNPNHQLFAEVMRTQDWMQSTYSPAPYTIKNMVYPVGGRFYPASITLPKGLPLPAGYKMPDGTVLAAASTLAADLVVTPTGPLSGTWRTVAGGGRSDITENSATRTVIGFKGVVADWDYETAYTHSRFDGLISFGPGKFSYSGLDPILATGGINVFGAQDATSQAALNKALLSGPEQTSLSTAHAVDFKVSKDVMQLSSGPLAVAFGGSYRKEEVNQISMPVLASGDEVGGGGPIPAVQGDRQVYSLFGEASIPITKTLEAQLAGRYDDYKNGFGVSFNKFSPKFGLRFQPVKDLLFRGSVAQGFRAPTLYENLRPFTEGNNTFSNYSDPVRCPNNVPVTSVNPVEALQSECNIQQTTATQGDKALKPEKSKQFSLGMVYSPSSNFSVSADYWDIKIDDAIVQLSEQSVFNNPTQYLANFYRYDPKDYPDGYTLDCSVAGATNINNFCGKLKAGSTNQDFPLAYIYLPYLNAARTFASGIDLSTHFKHRVENIGTFGVDLDGTYIHKHGYQYQGAPSVSDLGRYKDFGPAPRWRHMLTMTYAVRDTTLSLIHNYTAGYDDYTDDKKINTTDYPAVRKVSSYNTFDFLASYKGFKNIDLRVGMKNLADKNPPSSRTETGFQTGYDPTFTNPTGRMGFVTFKMKFL